MHAMPALEPHSSAEALSTEHVQQHVHDPACDGGVDPHGQRDAGDLPMRAETSTQRARSRSIPFEIASASPLIGKVAISFGVAFGEKP